MLKTKNYRDSLFLKYNVDSQGNPVSIEIVNEKSQVSPLNFTVHLMQIPDEAHRINITKDDGSQMFEVFDVETLGNDNYKVDYAHGIVYFSPDNAGKVMTCNYHGRGVEMISAGRVLVGSGTVDNLGEMLDDFNKAFAELDKYQQLIDRIKAEFDKMNSLIYDQQPLLILQKQIDLLNADNIDHVRWRNSSKVDGILTHDDKLISDNMDRYLVRSVVDSE